MQQRRFQQVRRFRDAVTPGHQLGAANRKKLLGAKTRGVKSGPIAIAVTNRQVTVGGPYFRQTTVPLFLLLLFLAGVGPLLPWRRTSGEQAARRLTVPAVIGAVVMVALAAGGVRNLTAVAAFGLAAFVLASNVGEMARGVRAYARASAPPRERSSQARA